MPKTQFFTGGFTPLDPPSGHCTWTPMGAYVAPIAPAFGPWIFMVMGHWPITMKIQIDPWNSEQDGHRHLTVRLLLKIATVYQNKIFIIGCKIFPY
jgi:hypothetical protein